METKHTPLPWSSIEADGFYDIRHFTDGKSFHEVVGSEGISKKEDADYIVLACNLHPQLLEALSNLERRVTFGTVTPEYLQEARRTIALATGKEASDV